MHKRLLPVLLLLPLFVSAQTWVQKNPFPGGPRNGAVNFVINNVAYAGLGDTMNDHYVHDFYRYDDANDTWTAVAPFPGPVRERAVSFVAGGKGYVGLGDDLTTQYQFFKDFYAYDPVANTWAQVADFPGTGRSDALAFGITNFGYVGFGYDSLGTRGDFWKYTPGSDSWQVLSNNAPINERWGSTAFSIGGKGYVVAGIKGTNFILSDIQEYNPANNSWTEKVFADGLNLPFLRANAFVLNNQAYICYGNMRFVTRYTPSSNQVTNLGDVLGEDLSRISPMAFSVNGKGYLGLGLGLPFGPGNVVLKGDVWQFTPPSVGASEAGLDVADAQILPTLSAGDFVFHLSANLQDGCTAQVFDEKGALVRSLNAVLDGQTLALGEFANGVYFVRILHHGNARTERIVLAR